MLTNCPQCRKPYVRAAGVTARICPNCTREEQEQCQAVYEYLRRNPGSKIDEITEATGVPMDRVLKLMNDGKIQIGNREATHCSGCNKDLSDAGKAAGTDRNGKAFCRGCNDRIQGQLKTLSHLGKGVPMPPLPSSSPSPPPKKKDDDRRYGLGGG